MNKLFWFMMGFVVCSYSYAENDKAFAWQVTSSEAYVVISWRFKSGQLITQTLAFFKCLVFSPGNEYLYRQPGS